jgi:hypothetical protein
MNRDMRRRLKKLESRLPRQQTDLEKIAMSIEEACVYYNTLLTVAVAYYLGDPDPEGSAAEAHARALGYSNTFEYRQGLEGKDATFDERERHARKKLLAKFGVRMEDNKEALLEAFGLMEAGLPEHYKEICHGVAKALR